MTNKAMFEILNNLWSLIKPYVGNEDVKAYKKIMTDNYNMLTEDRGEKFTDEWWKGATWLFSYPEKYKGTKYVEFAADLAMAVCDFWQFEERSETEATYHDFMNEISKAFIKEWERLRNDKETKKKTT